MALNTGYLPWPTSGGQIMGQVIGDPKNAVQNLGKAYQTGYDQSLAMNRANYGNIFQGYQNLIAQQQQSLRQIPRGYGRLAKAVLGDLQGANQSQLDDINDNYRKATADVTTSLGARGLGNTTVVDTMQRGVEFDRNRAETYANNQFAKSIADVRSGLGTQQLQSRYDTTMANAALGQNLLQWQNTINAPYPDVGLYAQLAQMYGQQQPGNTGQIGSGTGVGGVPQIGVPGPQLGYHGFTKPQSAAFYTGGGTDYDPGPQSGVNLYSSQFQGGGGGGGKSPYYGYEEPAVPQGAIDFSNAVASMLW